MIATSHTHQAAAGTSLAGSRYSGRPGVRTISYTDTVCARLTLHGRTVAEFTRSRISSFSALLAILRVQVPGCRGLAKLWVRNMSGGWTLTAPLMLYGEGTHTSPTDVLQPWDL